MKIQHQYWYFFWEILLPVLVFYRHCATDAPAPVVAINQSPSHYVLQSQSKVGMVANPLSRKTSPSTEAGAQAKAQQAADADASENAQETAEQAAREMSETIDEVASQNRNVQDRLASTLKTVTSLNKEADSFNSMFPKR